MSYQFEGQTFPTLKAFRAAFPAYGNYEAFLKDGASTVAEMERRIREKQAAGRKASQSAARRNTYTINKGARR